MHLTAVGVLLVAIAMLVSIGINEEPSTSLTVSDSADSSINPDHTQPTTSAAPSELADAANQSAQEDFLAGDDSEALATRWMTSAALTGGAFEASSQGSLNAGAQAGLHFSPAPTLSAKSPEVAETDTATATDTSAPTRSAEPSRTTATNAQMAGAQAAATNEIGDVMNQVAAAVARAESQRAGLPSDEAGGESSSEGAVAHDGDASEAQAEHAQPPLMLTRDVNLLRCPIPRKLSRGLREPHWTARVELPDGFVCAPSAVPTAVPSTGVQWQVYDQEAASPRACLIVSVRRAKGREGGLEWSLRGGAEDLPGLQLPVARKWLDALSIQLKVTAASLQAVAGSSTQQVPRELRSLAQNQRQLARQQLAVANRLLTLLAEIDRLASLLDDELLGHAELRESPDGPILAAYGTCLLDTATSNEASAAQE